MDSLRVSIGSDDEGGAGVEDGGAVLEPEVLAVHGDGHSALPEAILVDVVEGDEGVWVELGLVEAAKGNLAIVLLVGKAGDLERRDCVVDQSSLCERLDRRKCLLLREGLDTGRWSNIGRCGETVSTHGLCKTHQAIERNGVGGEVNTLDQSNTEGVLVELETSNIEVVSDDITLNISGSIGNSELLAGINKG